MGKMKEKYITLQNERRGKMTEVDADYIRSYLRVQVNWLKDGKISEKTLKVNMKDCRDRYPDMIDYDAEYQLIKQELQDELEVLKKLVT